MFNVQKHQHMSKLGLVILHNIIVIRGWQSGLRCAALSLKIYMIKITYSTATCSGVSPNLFLASKLQSSTFTKNETTFKCPFLKKRKQVSRWFGTPMDIVPPGTKSLVKWYPWEYHITTVNVTVTVIWYSHEYSTPKALCIDDSG